MKSVVVIICFLAALVGCRSNSHTPGRFTSSTNDYLYIDDAPYFISYSPLREFNEYKSIYYTLPNATLMQIRYNGEKGFEKKSYAAVWSIEHDSLYLSGILYAANDPFSLVEIPSPYYRVMEQLLHKTFRQESLQQRDTVFHPHNLCTADWFSGTLYAKPVRDAEKEYLTWFNEPFLKLTIKRGKLTASESINVTPQLTREEQKRGFDHFEDSLFKVITRGQQPQVKDSIDSVRRLPTPIYILP